MNILAIDPAIETGWATSNGYYGIWNLKKHSDESAGIRLLRFHAHIKEICTLEGINVVGYEKPGGRNYRSVINHAKLIGMVEKYCEENAIEYRGYSAKEIKKFATGKGNSNKEAMVKAAQEKLGYEGDNDNEADALWILALTMDELGM